MESCAQRRCWPRWARTRRCWTRGSWRCHLLKEMSLCSPITKPTCLCCGSLAKNEAAHGRSRTALPGAAGGRAGRATSAAREGSCRTGPWICWLSAVRLNGLPNTLRVPAEPRGAPLPAAPYVDPAALDPRQLALLIARRGRTIRRLRADAAADRRPMCGPKGIVSHPAASGMQSTVSHVHA